MNELAELYLNILRTPGGALCAVIHRTVGSIKYSSSM